jgi:hypothetical protein
VVKTVDRDSERILHGLREQDLEKQYRSEFQRYEEWRALQAEAPVAQATETKEQPKQQPKKGFTKLDFIFLGLWFLVAMLWRGCQSS